MRIVSAFTILSLLGDVIYPTAAYALTSGPAQPEFTSFEPVVTTNMVNEFTGDFTYNLPVLQIPGPNGGGYALSLSYHGGSNHEEEASWVGYGWTLNPGAINRQMRGLPDDWKDQQVKYWNKTIPQRTVSITGQLEPEAFSSAVQLSGHGTIRYNNYRGYGYTLGMGAHLSQGVVNIGYSVTDGSESFSLQVNPSMLGKENRADAKKHMADLKRKRRDKAFDRTSQYDFRPTKIKGAHLKRMSFNSAGIANAFISKALNPQGYSLTTPAMKDGEAWTLSLGGMVAPAPLPVGMNAALSGQYSVQQPLPEQDVKSSGYLYTTNSDAEGLDYHTENLSSYERRDKFLSLPVSDADQFAITGEGISGSARLFQRQIAPFRPVRTTSTTTLARIGGEFTAGAWLGLGWQFQLGEQHLSVNDWSSGPTGGQPFDEPYLFRMANDQGGWIRYSDNDDAEQAEATMGAPGASLAGRYANNGERPGRSSHMGFTLVNPSGTSETTSTPSNFFRRYEKGDLSKGLDPLNSLAFLQPIEFDRAQLPDDQLGELSILNGQGQRYNYGLPVYARNEHSLSYSIEEGNTTVTDLSRAHSVNDPDDAAFKAGRDAAAPYATSHLLTSIQDPDYLDLTNNGPSLDDLGGFTIFRYTQQSGSSDKSGGGNWYNWRMPYSGFDYSIGAISECHDDRISYADGEKELYYLATVETKSHVAVFELSDPGTRRDAYGAPTIDPWQASPAQGLDKQRYLKSIKLYSRAEYAIYCVNTNLARPIKTVHFDYDYSAWKGAGANAPSNSYANEGKLTLKRVWTEYNGTVPAKIAPYQFDYTYAPSYPAPYAALVSPYAGVNETPSYGEAFAPDPWGNYRADGQARAQTICPWIDQAVMGATTPTFDPSAWQLKRITLPSGGEIHVQYEPDDYLFVQDQPSHGMVSMLGWNTGPTQQTPLNAYDEVLLDLSVLGAWPTTNTDEALLRMRNLIQNEYVGKDKRMFFRMLYRFMDNVNGTDPIAHGKNMEFIEGYAEVVDVQIVQATNPGEYTLSIRFADVDHSLPEDVCRDLFKAQKRGRTITNANCSCYDGPSSVAQLEQAGDLIDFGVAQGGTPPPPDPLSTITGAAGFLIGFVTSPASCDEVVLDHSYLRVPLPMRKYGGGLRVKRLLMVDPTGIAEGYPAVYGTEYKYAIVDDEGNELSSGVATNEPASISAENPLVRPLERFSQGWPSRVIAGRDREQSEGPLGMSIYPAPSVGYSQVIISNIGQTQLGVGCTPNGAGFIAKEFNTAKDHPVKFEMTGIGNAPPIYLPVITPWVTTIIDRKSVTQGFVLKFNNMHGQIKSETTYSGNVSELLSLNPAGAAYSSRSEYDYYGDGEEIPTLVDRYGHTALRPLGQEMDVTIEGRTSKDEMDDAAVEVDIGTGIPLPPGVSASPSVTYINTTIRAHTTTKVITYPAILKRTHTKVDGIIHMTEPIAFDPATGEPAIVRTHDGFLPNLGSTADLSSATAGIYTKHTIPAHMPYPNLGQIAKGERKVVLPLSVTLTCTSATANAAQVSVAPGSVSNGVCDLLGALCQGDLLAFYPTGSPGAKLYHLERVDPAGPTLFLHKAIQSSALASSAVMNRMEVVRSGCSNQLGAPAGEYTVYDDGQLNLTSDWSLRQLFVDALNTMLWGPVAIDYANGAPYSSHAVNVPPGLSFLNDAEECGVFDGEVYFEPVQQGSNTVPALISSVAVPPEGFDYCDDPFEMSFVESMNSWGSFALDPSTGQIVYKPADSPCYPILITCPQLCPAEPEYVVEKVVSCNATVYSDIWNYEEADYGITAGIYNPFETGKRGQWRPDSTYAFREATESGGLNRNTGWFTMPFFDYDVVTNNDPNRWIETNHVVAYSPDGQALEEENALGIRSCSKFGYDRQLPYLVAQNSASPLVLFESFEKQYTSGTYLEDRVQFSWNSYGTINTAAAHAGKKSFSSSTASAFLYRSGTRSLGYTLAAPKAMQVKAWFRSKDVTGFIDPIAPAVTLNTQPAVPMKVVARVGEWVQCQATVDLPSGSAAYSIDITCVNVAANSGTTWIDDVRVQPKDAQMTAYVYDPNNYRLLATFDDQHFGMYYQYNDEGKLVRKLIETERGLRTVQETQYNTPQDQNRQWP
ncbi:MAG: hypothetical protein IPP26_08620 [Flavobacteriales bacterium]|nr:hypothetical protein [Flavobacteriales bacterium]